jgi:uncharacterized protein (TIGR02678 family)
MTPIITASRHSEELALVRRHATALKQSFQTVLGYPLMVEAGFARLIKQPLSPDAPARGAIRSNNNGRLSPRAYTFLALSGAALLSQSISEQVLLSALVEQIRSDAAAAGIDVGDSQPDRRALVAALGHLIDLGVLTETDGTVTAWGERREEALLTVNQALMPHFLARPLVGLTEPNELWARIDSDDERQPRRTLRRRLVENPLTRREDLTPEENGALSRERREIGRTLDEVFGLTLEVRVEGALTYDLSEKLTDVVFPGQGKFAQAALLLLDALIDLHRPRPAPPPTSAAAPSPDCYVAGPRWTKSWRM